ncbi:MAG TPA: NAD(P)-binding domain-containing protein, partial [Streptosporangiaceae bacterium]|nr:NAD(P)-binding domain-containing protein [Streptosporangiaceae bacterium]
MPNPAGPPTPHHPARLRVGIIGAGRVGTALGAALARAGHHLTGVSAVSEASVQRAARMLPGVPVAQPQEVLAEADLALLTVPDDVLP